MDFNGFFKKNAFIRKINLHIRGGGGDFLCLPDLPVVFLLFFEVLRFTGSGWV